MTTAASAASDTPPGWSYNPSTWGERLWIVGTALIGSQSRADRRGMASSVEDTGDHAPLTNTNTPMEEGGIGASDDNIHRRSSVGLLVLLVIVGLYVAGWFSTPHLGAFRFAFYLLLVLFVLIVGFAIYDHPNEGYDPTARVP